MLQSFKTFLANNSKLQVAQNVTKKYADKTGKIIIQHPFWVLVIGSLGIHAAVAIATVNPSKKAEPTTETAVSMVPVVKVPETTLSTKPKSNQSVFANLFVKSTNNKTSSPFNKPLSSVTDKSLGISNVPLKDLDLSSVDDFADLPAVSSDLALSVPPLSANPQDDAPPQFVKPQNAPISTAQPTPQVPRFTTSGKIDNANAIASNTTEDKNISNIKPEFQNGGLKNQTSPTNNDKNQKSQDPRSQDPRSANVDSSDRPEQEIGNIASLYKTDKQIIDLAAKNLIVTTQIASNELLKANPDLNSEKGITWVPPKTIKVAGKKGTVIFMWLVDPSGEIKSRYVKSSGSKELDDLAREAADKYKFQPLENPASRKYRLVTAEYDFP